MIFSKASFIFVVVALVAIFCGQSVEAARGPKISSKVYLDIKHGDKDLGRSAFTSLLRCRLSIPVNDVLKVVLGLFGGVSFAFGFNRDEALNR
jgi:hypothetical protein